MIEYSIEEYADMQYLYGDYTSNTTAVYRYGQRFHLRRVPDKQTILSIAHLHTIGPVLPSKNHRYRNNRIEPNGGMVNVGGNFEQRRRRSFNTFSLFVPFTRSTKLKLK